jgi:hypothetical protein
MLLPAMKRTVAVPFTTKPPSFVQPTKMGALVPVIAALLESVAVIVCVPADRRL